MGTIADYTGGSILESISKALHFFDSTEGPLTQDEKGQHLLVGHAGKHLAQPGIPLLQFLADRLVEDDSRPHRQVRPRY